MLRQLFDFVRSIPVGWLKQSFRKTVTFEEPGILPEWIEELEKIVEEVMDLAGHKMLKHNICTQFHNLLRAAHHLGNKEFLFDITERLGGGAFKSAQVLLDSREAEAFARIKGWQDNARDAADQADIVFSYDRDDLQYSDHMFQLSQLYGLEAEAEFEIFVNVKKNKQRLQDLLKQFQDLKTKIGIPANYKNSLAENIREPM